MARKKACEEKIVKLILLKEGIYDLERQLIIACPISIYGAGQDETILQRHGIMIQGPKKEKKRVDMQGMTMKGSSESGLYNNNGLSFLCKDMTFTQCEYHGVYASNTKGRLINCVITQCKWSGIFCEGNTLIELEGDQTKVDGNVTSGDIVMVMELRPMTHRPQSIFSFHSLKNLFPLTIMVTRIMAAKVKLQSLTMTATQLRSLMKRTKNQIFTFRQMMIFERIHHLYTPAPVYNS